jgi:cytochrome b
MNTTESTKSSRLWDLPTRLFHLAIIILVAVCWYTAENMHVFTFGPQDGPTLFEIHTWAGISLLSLIIFRLIWGLVGSTTSEFSHFVKGPGAIIAYMKGPSDPATTGHNPLGALSVVAMIGVLLVQPITGLLAQEDTFGLEGPLKHLISKDLSLELAGLHDTLFDILTILLILHIGAVLFYEGVRRDNIIGPMVTGRTKKDTPDGLIFEPSWRAFIILCLSSAAVWLTVTYA